MGHCFPEPQLFSIYEMETIPTLQVSLIKEDHKKKKKNIADNGRCIVSMSFPAV